MPVESSLASEIAAAAEQVTTEKTDIETNNEKDTNVVGDDKGNKESLQDTSGTSESDINVQAGIEEKVDEKQEIIKPIISDSVLTQAIQAGFTLEEAREYGNDKLLQSAVNKVLSASKPADIQVQESNKFEELVVELPELDPEVFEPEVISVLSPVYDVVKKLQDQVNDLRSKQGQIEEIKRQANDQEISQWFNKKMSELDPDLLEVVGKEPYGSGKLTASQKAKQDEIADLAAIILAGYKNTGKQIPSRDDIFDKAAATVLSSDIQKIKENKLSAELDKRNKQHIRRASGAKATGSTDPFAETAAFLDEKYFAK